MLPSSDLTTARVLDVFTEEIAARGGRVTDTFHADNRLFTRSVLAPVEEVRPGDGVQGGVALRATEDAVCLYPYVFRQVCRNGAIMAQTLASRSLGNVYERDPDEAIESIREATGACCAPEVFFESVDKMRTACDAQVDLALTLLPHISRLSGRLAELMPLIVRQFFQEGDLSQFGVANAFTAVARETRDPETRWNLEELGGGIAIGIVPRPPTDGGRAAARTRREVVVG